MKIREAIITDVQKWWQMVYSVKSEDLPTLFKMVKDITIASTNDYLTNILNSTGSFALLCFDKNIVIGSVDVIRKTRPEESHIADIGMCILKEYRNTGIGTKLLIELFKKCKKQGKIEKIELEVFSNNIGGIKLYEKLGFEYEGCRKGSIIKNNKKLDVYMMAKHL
jgi:RimJ/RimL family protein N-acetyltransferase